MCDGVFPSLLIASLCCGYLQVTKETRLIDALSIFVQRRVSALPVVNDNNQVENIFAKFDVIVSYFQTLYLHNIRIYILYIHILYIYI